MKRDMLLLVLAALFIGMSLGLAFNAGVCR